METTIGKCSLCGGNVTGWTGAWFGINPPPAARCKACGAFDASSVITMTNSPTIIKEIKEGKGDE